MPEFTGTNDLRSYFSVLWRWKLLFLAFVVAAPVATLLIERNSAKTYRSSALVGVNQTTVDTSLLNGGGSFSTNNVVAIAELVTTTPVAEVAGGLMHPRTTAGQIVGEVSASGDATTNFITITAEDLNAKRAAAIANAFAKAITLQQRRSAVGQLQSAIKGVQAQLAQQNVGPNDVTTRSQLQQQLSQLRAARFTQGSDAAILQLATPAAIPTGLNTRRVLEIGLLIGLLLGFGAVVFAENSDRRLRTPDDLEAITQLPLLAAIAPSAFAGELETSMIDEEAFQMLRTSLMYFNVDRKLASVLITSPGEKDGKTTVAARLALAAATAGLTVTLVDADLRRAQVSARFGTQTTSGVASVLAGTGSLAEALTDHPLDSAGSGQLTILPAGPPPPNPSALLSSEAMRELLRELESQSDLVIVDTPAALAVSDPVPLMRLTTGVIIVARMNRSSRHAIRRLMQIITSAHGTLLGVVATGVSAASGYDNTTASHYVRHGANGRHRSGRLRVK